MSPAVALSAATEAPASARRLAVLLMGGALLSKALGLVREVLVARAIGASMIADSFRGGLTAVMLPLAFLQNESVPAILIPTYREWREEGDGPRRFAALSVALVLAASGLLVLVEAGAKLWIDLLLGGFSEQARSLTLHFTRVMALAMPASVLLCCLSAAEIARGQSRVTSIRATLLNVAVIAGVGLLLLTGQAVMLAWSFSLAFNAVAAWALWLLLREGALDLRGIGPGAVIAGGRHFLRRLRPMMLQPIAEHGQVWIERLLASALAVGTLASLDYARTLSDCAVLLVSQPLGLAVLAAGPRSDVRAQMDALARPVLALAIPGSIFLVAFAPEVVQLVLGRGAFGAEAVASTSLALRGIATGLWATTLGWILLRMLNSAGRNLRATSIMAVAYAANALTAVALVHWLGGFALGLGEAVRGVVLLGGVAVALGGGMHLLRLLLIAAPAAAALARARGLCRRARRRAAAAAGVGRRGRAAGRDPLVRADGPAWPRAGRRAPADLAAAEPVMPLSVLERSLSATADGSELPWARRLASSPRALASGRGCAFTFHRAAPSAIWAGLPNRAFYLDLGFLERLLAHLQRAGWAVVKLEEALRRSARPGEGRFVNFSVDDCYRDTAELVAPLFRRLGVPLTLFVTTGIPDRTMRLRDAGLETIVQGRELVAEGGVSFRLDTQARRRAAFAAISRSWTEDGADAAYLRFCDRHRADPDALDRQHAISWPMLEALRDDPLVEIGAHTVSHPRVSALDERAARAELEDSRSCLQARLGRAVRHFAFPFGRRDDCGARDFALARDVGFSSAATTRKGLILPGADPFRLPRNTLNGAHRHLLLAGAHTTGLSGLAARIAGRD